MDPISAELLAVLSRKVFARIVSDPRTVHKAGDFLLPPAKIAEGIKNMLGNNDLKLGNVTEASDFHDGLVDMVMNKIKELQQGNPRLEADGLLGEQTLKFLLTRVFGHHNRDPETLPKSTTTSEPGKNGNALRYFIEQDRLPEVAGLSQKKVLKLLDEAWDSWSQVCKLDAKHAGSPEEANVIVQVKHLNEPESVVAIADVGPPRGNQLNLTFDLAETWTETLFQTAAAHEIGHILGLHHSNVPDQLMNAVLNDGIMDPQPDDIAKVSALWS